jgi:sarcosine oxidase subunit gamma
MILKEVARMSDIRRESPLRQLRHTGRSTAWPAAAGVHLSERAFAGHVILHGRSEDQAFCQAAAGVLDLNLPLQPNSVISSDSLTVFWQGPDEWLITTAPDQETALIRALHEKLEGLFAAVVDVSSAQTIIRLGGSDAVSVIAKGCSLDLDTCLSAPGQCAQTLLAKASVLLWRSAGDNYEFEIVVKRSFADYLWRWLEDAAAEYRVTID